jgi:hypothetical protein
MLLFRVRAVLGFTRIRNSPSYSSLALVPFIPTSSQTNLVCTSKTPVLL